MTVHNGPGLRTNVHLLGCPLSCRWCSTPESQPMRGGLGYDSARCIGCGACVKACAAGALTLGVDCRAVLDREACAECFSCLKECYAGALWRFGTDWTVAALLEELKKDAPFFRQSGGGVTLSGGECLLRADDELEALCKGLGKAGIPIGVDTCGHVPWENIQRLLPYLDFFLWDIKALDPERHKRYTGVDNRLILENLRRLDALGTELYIRYPLIPGVNDSETDIHSLCELLHTLPSVRELHLLPFHHMGKRRYEHCGRPYPMEGVKTQSREVVEARRRQAEALGIKCQIIG